MQGRGCRVRSSRPLLERGEVPDPASWRFEACSKKKRPAAVSAVGRSTYVSGLLEEDDRVKGTN